MDLRIFTVYIEVLVMDRLLLRLIFVWKLLEMEIDFY